MQKSHSSSQYFYILHLGTKRKPLGHRSDVYQHYKLSFRLIFLEFGRLQSKISQENGQINQSVFHI